MTNGGHRVQLHYDRAFNWGGCNETLTIVLKFRFPIIRLYLHASSSCHIARD